MRIKYKSRKGKEEPSLSEIASFDESVHRTWIQLLVDHGYNEVASIAIDTEINIESGSEDLNPVDGPPSFVDYINITFRLPYGILQEVMRSDRLMKLMERGIKSILDTQEMYFGPESSLPNDPNYYRPTDATNYSFEYLMHLIEPDADWQEVVRKLIVGAKDANQAVVTEKLFQREGKNVLEYNEMKFGSHSEIRIAQELERRRILFFPLPMGVRAETDVQWKDHREPDFVICVDGKWGILEVSHHQNRFEKDSEKSMWWKKSGILCVEHFTSERCYNESGKVVDEFLSVLIQHR